MGNLFPSDVGVSHVRGLIRIIKENNGAISISKLAEEAEEDLDDLLPLIEACKLLGFVTIAKSKVKLTQKGEKLASAPRSIIRESLSKVEPFKSAISALSEGSRTTSELFDYLIEKGVFPKEGEHSAETLLKLLIGWGVRSKLLSYDEHNDTWILVG